MNALVKIDRAKAYDPASGERVCEAVASGASLEAACKAESVSVQSFLRWVRHDPDLAEAYTRARQAKADMLADAVVPLADSALGMDSAGVQAVKHMVDARKWAASKLNPTAYGDKLDVTSAGKALPTPVHQVDARVQSIVMQAAERMRLAQSVDAEAQSLLE